MPKHYAAGILFFAFYRGKVEKTLTLTEKEKYCTKSEREKSYE